MSAASVSSAPVETPGHGRRPALVAVRTLMTVALALLGFGLLIGLTVVGRHGGGPIQSLDAHAGRWFTGHRYTVGLAKIIATYGDAGALGIICAVVTLGLLARWRSPLALTPIVAFLGGEGQVFLIRQVIHRPRPLTADYPAPGALRGVHETSWSFPSGHATTVTAVLFACLGVLALTRRVAWPWVVAALASVYVASTRLVLGVHWLSDVSTGLLIGAGWGVTVAVVATRLTWDDLRALGPHDRARDQVN